jgi:hypothetical protein
MSLRDDIQSHINELQDLLKETNEETLLDKARKQWGEDDSRYEVLEQFVDSPSPSKFRERADPPDIKPDPDDGVQNKPVK